MRLHVVPINLERDRKGLLQIHIQNKVFGLQQPLFIRKYSYRLENLAVVLQ
jgi:hypothetical protein